MRTVPDHCAGLEGSLCSRRMASWSPAVSGAGGNDLDDTRAHAFRDIDLGGARVRAYFFRADGDDSGAHLVRMRIEDAGYDPGSTGCQGVYNGQLLPSPWYQTDDIQYFAPGPEFKLSREAAAMKAYNADLEAQERGQ